MNTTALNLQSVAKREKLMGRVELSGVINSAAQEIERLEARIAELERDKARLDWIIEWMSFNDSPIPTRDWNDLVDAREAIDECVWKSLIK